MANPELNEKAIVQMLDKVCSPKSAERLVSGAFLALMDGFDRKIMRDPYVQVAQNAFALADMLSRLEISNVYRERLIDGKLTVEGMDSAIKQLTERGEVLRERLVKELELITQCPMDDDTRH